MILKSKVDTNEYIPKTLKNGIKALIIQNDIFTKSSCALTVNVGSFDEPDEFQGLAHFLEHMLFMGTAKYPGENMFSDFLSQHNGYSNAYTADEITTYYCDIDSEYLFEMADMFSQFFISPLFNKNTVEREISAVDSEFLNTLNNREWRIQALHNDLMKEDKKEKRFSCGNAQTLRKESNLDSVINFWKESYSSDIMSLVVCGNKPVEELEKILVLFEEIPNINKGRIKKSLPSYSNSADLFKKETLSKIIRFKPLDNKKEILIRTVLKPLRDKFKVNPLEFISFKMSKKEHGGLLHVLKSKKLAFDISISSLYHSKFTDFTIQISLTNKGMSEFMTVLSIVNSYLSEMKIDQIEYNRLMRIEDEEFNFKQSETPIEMAENICPDLLFYPIEYVLKHDYVFEDFDYHLILKCLKDIQDASKWIVLLSDADSSFDRKEEYYSVEYSIEPNNIQFTCRDLNIDTVSVLNDEFIDEIKILKSETRYLKRDVFEHGEVNLVFESEFNVPKCEMFIFLSSPEISANPLQYQIFFLMINDIFHEKNARFLTNIHVDLSVELNKTGIMIKIEGFSSRLIEVCKMFFQSIQQLKDFNNFDVIRQELEDSYSEILVESPYCRLFEVFCNRVSSSLSSEELLLQIKNIKKEMLEIKTEFYTKILAVGNIEYEKIIDLYEFIKTKNSSPVIKINPMENIIEFETFDKFNNGVAILYKINDQSIKIFTRNHRCEMEQDYQNKNEEEYQYNYNTAIGRFVHQISHEKFFNELRTIEEFGYIVYCTVVNFMSAEYLMFVVQSEKQADFIEKRILKFIEDLKVCISEMNEDEFENHRESLIGFYEEPILNLNDFSRFSMNLFLKGRLDLNHDKKMIEIVKKLSKEDILSSEILNDRIRVNSVRNISQ